MKNIAGNNKKKTVYVGLSGGVDSSVSALLLKEKGFDVVGVFIDTWQPDFFECTSAEDRRDAMRVCSSLGIPFKTFDAKEQYRKEVVDYMVEEYRVGRTPNPDIMCNRSVKFGTFFNWAMSDGADLIATGHYARVMKTEGEGGKEEFQLYKGADRDKDQSYFLWAVPAEVFSRTIFPVGDLKKSEVRRIARTAGLTTATKKDSQGICFLGKVDIKKFLSHYIPRKKGEVIDESGSVIGFHDGAQFYTIGQRHGFTVEKKTPDSTPFYIIEKNIPKNILVVSGNPQKHTAKEVILSGVNWIPKSAYYQFENKEVECMSRYRQKERGCRFSNGKNGLSVTFREPQAGLAQGQSVVIYSGERCPGGGIIDRISQ